MGEIVGPEGSRLEISDTFRPVDGTTVQIDREVTISANRVGAVFRISYSLTAGTAVSLTAAIWEITKRQMAAFRTAPHQPDFSLDDSLDYRTRLTQQYYRKWDKAENPKEPAGYMVHFSPRSGKTQGTLLEYGFAGAQTLLAYVGPGGRSRAMGERTMKRQSTTSRLLRQMNRAAVINLVRQEDVISPTLIAAKLNVSMPTVTRVLEDLIEEDLVEYSGFGESTRGRPPGPGEI